jgi:hypothetical protein
MVDPWGTVLATAAGHPGVVAGEVGFGSAAYLGALYFNASGLDFGAADRLLERAVAWVSDIGSDEYTFQVDAGDTITISTTTPGGGPYAPENSLDPYVELYYDDGVDPSAIIGSDTNGAADGRNALLTYNVPIDAGGQYRVRVGGTNSFGSYTLDVNGVNFLQPPFEVVFSIPADGAEPSTLPATLRIELSDEVLLTSSAAADVTVNGVPADSLTVIDGRTLEFDISSANTGDGTYLIEIAPGALQSVSGQAVEGFSATVSVDGTGPIVTSSSIANGAAIAPGNLTFTATFNEPLASGGTLAASTSLVNTFTGNTINAASSSYDSGTSTLVIDYSSLPEGDYTLTLHSDAVNGFRDLRNNPLDGAPSFPLPFRRRSRRRRFCRSLLRGRRHGSVPHSAHRATANWQFDIPRNSIGSDRDSRRCRFLYDHVDGRSDGNGGGGSHE